MCGQEPGGGHGTAFPACARPCCPSAIRSTASAGLIPAIINNAALGADRRRSGQDRAGARQPAPDGAKDVIGGVKLTPEQYDRYQHGGPLCSAR